MAYAQEPRQSPGIRPAFDPLPVRMEMILKQLHELRERLDPVLRPAEPSDNLKAMNAPQPAPVTIQLQAIGEIIRDLVNRLEV